MEGQTRWGSVFEKFVVIVILLNVGSFVLSTEESIASSCQGLFDTIEIVTVIIFTIEYGFRLWSIPSASDFKDTQKFGRFSWAFTNFFSIIDLLSIVPFYVDLVIQEDLPAMQFIRLIRLFRVLKADPRFTSAFSFFGVVYEENRQLLATGGLLGGIVWLIIASCYYVIEKHNPSMVWEHPKCYNGLNSTDAGDDPFLPPCYNRFRSIPSAAYYTLLNLFGEFPLVDQHSNWGRVVATFAAVVAVAVFAIPTGVFGAGFESMISRRKDAEAAAVDASAVAEDESPRGISVRGGGGFDGDARRTGLIELIGSEKILFDKDGAIGRRLANKNYVAVLACVIATNVLLFMATTLQSMQEILFADEDVKTLALTGWAFSIFELLSLLLLCYDYVLRLMSSPCTYLLSAYGIIDLGSVIPGLVSLCMFGFSGAMTLALIPTLLRALQLIRLLKLERYVKAFNIFTGIIQDNVDVLLVSGFFALVLMMFSSTFMYYSERNNPDPNISKYYTSIPNAMWITMLNLSGESPLADFSTCGKIISGIVGVFAVGVFAIPIGLIGACFEDFISELGDNLQREVQTAEKKVKSMELPLIKKSGWNWNLYAFLDGRTQSGRVFQSFIAILILATVAQAIIQTVPGVCAEAQKGCPLAMNVFETAAVVIFTVEYCARLVASFEDPVMGNAAIPPLAYALSFYGLIDALAIFPYYLALVSTRADQIDNYLRLLRMFRLLKLDKFVPSISLIDDVFRAKRTGLLVSTFAAGIFWLVFSSALYLAEREDGAEKGCYTEAERFSSVPSTLQYDLILLSGDYPLVDFTTWGRWLNVLQIFVAVGVVAVPSGLIASGFSELLVEQKNRKLARRQQAAIHLQRCIRGRLARKRFRETVDGAKALEQEKNELILKRKATRSPIERAQYSVLRFLGGKMFAGMRYRSFIAGLIALNVAAVIIESEPSLGTTYGVAATQTQMFFNIFEAFSVVVFSIDYVGRLFSSPVDGNYKSVFRYVFSFYGIVDLVSIAPWYIELILGQNGVPFDASSFRVLRFFRLLQLEIFTSALSQLDAVWRNSKSMLQATGIVAFMVWVAIATMFYLFERNNECVSDAFSSIPSSMYYVAIFLGGEWGQVDFNTIGGKLMCILTVVLGIGLYGLPVGSIFESFSEVLAEQSEMQ